MMGSIYHQETWRKWRKNVEGEWENAGTGVVPVTTGWRGTGDFQDL
jgi:hypothetical protein